MKPFNYELWLIQRLLSTNYLLTKHFFFFITSHHWNFKDKILWQGITKTKDPFLRIFKYFSHEYATKGDYPVLYVLQNIYIYIYSMFWNIEFGRYKSALSHISEYLKPYKCVSIICIKS